MGMRRLMFLLVAVVGNIRPAHAALVLPQNFAQTQITAAKTFDNPHEAER
jgi:hypothetical protein